MGGPSILYLHGFASGPQSAKASATVMWASERGIPIEVPDLNGEGFQTLTITSQLKVAREALSRLRAPVVVVGSSLGGWIASLLVEAKAPLAGALLMAPAFDFGRRLSRALGAQVMEQWRRAGHIKIYHHSERAERDVGIALIDDARGYNPFPDMDVPCTIVHGVHDPDVPVELSRLYVRDNLNVRLVEVEDDHTLLQSMPRVLDELDALMKRL
ncbi:MAG: YqiA/YcfP family alpha/beta fold hydrolase [Myxococcota bacterium]